MIAEYDPDGRIFHIVNDPVPAGLAARLTDLGHAFVDLPPVPLPDVPELGEDGEPVYDIETRELFEEDGVTPLRDESGEQLVEVKKTPRMITGRTQSVAVSFEGHYVDQGALAERPSLPVPAQIALTLNQKHTITGLPECTLRFGSDTLQVSEGFIDIEGEEVGIFHLIFEAWPYQRATCEVTINAP